MDIRDLLENVKNNKVDIEDALNILKDLPYEDLWYANIDHHRQIRNGYPEVIYCEGKTDEHILGIIEKMTEKKANILGTRCRKETFEKVKLHYNNAEYEEVSKILKIKNNDIAKRGKGKILILSGGTSDIPIADEALDIYTECIYMKKNRPANKISILCEENDLDKFVEILLKESSTFGVRYHKYNRKTLYRKFDKIDTEYGEITVKLGYYNNKLIKVTPEYEDCKNISKSTGIPLQQLLYKINYILSKKFDVILLT